MNEDKSPPLVKRSLADAHTSGFEFVADLPHGGTVKCIAFSSDGGTLASGSGDEDAVYHFVKDNEIVTVSAMHAIGYTLPRPGAG